MENSDGKSQASEVAASQHVLVCALHELGSLVQRLGSSASPLVAEPATGEFHIFFLFLFYYTLFFNMV